MDIQRERDTVMRDFMEAERDPIHSAGGDLYLHLTDRDQSVVRKMVDNGELDARNSSVSRLFEVYGLTPQGHEVMRQYQG